MNVARTQFLFNEKTQSLVKRSHEHNDFSDAMKSIGTGTEMKSKEPQRPIQHEDRKECDIECNLTNKRIDIWLMEPLKHLKDAEYEVLEEIASILDLTEDELKNLLSILGITLVDLKNPDCLTNIVLHANQSTNPGAALTNETVSCQLYELKQLLEQWDLGQWDLEQLKLEQQTLEQGIKTTSVMAENDSVTQLPVEETQDSFNEMQKADGIQKLEVIMDGKEPPKENQDSFQQTNSDLNTFVAQLQQASMERNAETFDTSIEMTTIVDQIVEQIKVKIGEHTTSMELTLTPEHLGKVNLTIVSKDGVMTAQFVAETEMAKKALESQMQLLKQNFEQQGLKVNEVEVMVSSNFLNSQSGGFSEEGFQQPSGKKKQGQSVTRLEFFDSDGKTEENEVLLQKMSTMDITA